MRMQSLRTRGLSMSEPPKQPDDHPTLGSFSQAFLKLLRPDGDRRNSHRGSDPTPADRSSLEKKGEVAAADLPAVQQLEIQKLLFNTGEVPLGVYPMGFHKAGGSLVTGRALLSTSQVYLFPGEDSCSVPAITTPIDSLTVLCLHPATSIFLLSDLQPDSAALHLSSPHLSSFVKAVQQLVHQCRGTFIPTVVFEDYGKMIAYAERLSQSEIEDLHSVEATKTLELIMTTSGDPYESKLLQQPCTYRSQSLSFLLTSKRLYLISKDYRAVETRKLSEVATVEFSHGTVSIVGKEWRLGVEMQDCAKVIELARKSA